MSLHVPPILTKIECEAWATPREDLELDELVATLRETGNQIIEIDYKNNRVKLLHVVDKLED